MTCSDSDRPERESTGAVDLAADDAALYRSLVHGRPDAIMRLDTGWCIREVNPASEALAGYGAVELVGRSIVDLAAPDEQCRASAQLVLAEDGEPQPFTVTMRHRDGRHVVPGRAAIPIREDGRITGIHITGRDVTAERQVERVLRETTVGSYPAIVPEIAGPGFLTGMHAFVVQPDDPVGGGFLVRSWLGRARATLSVSLALLNVMYASTHRRIVTRLTCFQGAP